LIKVLWLASWYPGRLDKFDGDFIQRHARAVALNSDVFVIFVKKDIHLKINSCTTEIITSPNLTEKFIYYNPPKTGFSLFDKYLSYRDYNMHMRNAISDYVKNNGRPGLVHVHIAMKAGINALWAKKKWNIPFIVTEHWTAYLENADQQLSHYSSFFKNGLKQVLKKASAITVVSNYLGKSIQSSFPGIKYSVIPNVVNTDLFYPVQEQDAGKIRFIHISSMNYQKNTEAIILALSLLKDDHPVELYLYGPVNPSLEALINDIGLQQIAFAQGEVSQEQLSKAIQQSDALILYSRFETFGCVLIEANACGIPVIVSDLQVFHEIIEEGVNGIFAEGENPAALAEKLRQFIAQKDHFNKNEIAAMAAKKYNYKKVGQQFIELYNKTAATST